MCSIATIVIVRNLGLISDICTELQILKKSSMVWKWHQTVVLFLYLTFKRPWSNVTVSLWYVSVRLIPYFAHLEDTSVAACCGFSSAALEKKTVHLPAVHYCFENCSWAVALWHSQASGGWRPSADPAPNVARGLPWCRGEWGEREIERKKEKRAPGFLRLFLVFLHSSSVTHSSWFWLSLSDTLRLSSLLALFMWLLWTSPRCSSPILAPHGNTQWRVLHHVGLEYILVPTDDIKPVRDRRPFFNPHMET